ncbi:MAG: hypothetical protein ACRC0V_00275 [Fusobacteriaceae bacterium]
MIYKELSFDDIWTIAQQDDQRKNNFTYEGLKALYEYLDDISGEIGDGTGLAWDWIGICCEYDEWESVEKALEYYDFETLEQLENNTTVIQFGENKIITSQF